MAAERHAIDVNARALAQTGNMAIQRLRDIAEATNIPYLKQIAGASLLMMDIFLTVRTNKVECARMVEHVKTILLAIASICDAETELTPVVLRSIAAFSETLEKVLSFMRHQINSGNLIRRVVRYLEDASLLSECQAALEHAVQLFRLQSQVATVATLGQIQAFTKNQYELTSLAAARESFTTLGTMQSRTSNISLLPGSPKIFHGRDADMQHIISNLVCDNSSQNAILGPGGVGKSSLALAVLYEPRVVAKFGSERHFVSCESSQSANDIAAAILSHFVLERDRNPIKAVLQHLSGLECPAVIVLDNMETPWEIPGERTVVEDFLSHLSSINQLHLIITMRGEERPGNVRWTRPFLRPLSPLSDAAARQVFFDITDVAEDDNLLDELLSFTDNLPLAVTLMASLVSFEGAASVVERWKSDRISLFSDGADKNSNLSTSIAMSLSSPRLTAIPDAMTLLRLLSVLPDGVTDLALVQMGLPIVDISLCRVTLCRTSLAYVDRDRRLKALVPIREHIRASCPPPPPLISSMQNFFYRPVGVFYRTWAKAVGTDLVHRISADLGNISSLLHIALGTENLPSHETLTCIVDFAHFTRVTNIGPVDLLQSIFGIIQTISDADLQGRYFLELAHISDNKNEAQSYRTKALGYFRTTNNMPGQAMAYHDLSFHYDASKALEACEQALSLAQKSQDHSVLALVLRRMSSLQHNEGNIRQAWALTLEAQRHAQAVGDLETEYLCILNRVSHFITVGNYSRASSLCAELLLLAKGLGIEKGHRGCSALGMQAEIHLRKTEYEESRRINVAVAQMSSWREVNRTAHAVALLNLVCIDMATGINITPDSICALKQAYNAVPQPGVHWEVATDIITADIFHRLGQLAPAQKLYAQCLRVAQGQSAEATNQCFQKLGENAYAGSQIDLAFHYYVLHFVTSRKMGDWEGIHQALRRLGDVFFLRRDDETAHSLFSLSLEGFNWMDIHKGRGDCLFRLGELWMGRGDVQTACAFWQRARPLFERSSQKAEVARCDERLSTVP